MEMKVRTLALRNYNFEEEDMINMFTLHILSSQLIIKLSLMDLLRLWLAK